MREVQSVWCGQGKKLNHSRDLSLLNRDGKWELFGQMFDDEQATGARIQMDKGDFWCLCDWDNGGDDERVSADRRNTRHYVEGQMKLLC